ncbi:MAG: hypothetical protein ABIP12_00720, partial [Terriglobales bacterium]
MYCWNCGHKNPEMNKFCGDCGKAQVRPPVAENVNTVKAMNPPARERQPVAEKQPAPLAAPVVPPPGTGITPNPRRFVSTTPLIGESRVVRETTMAPTAAVADLPKEMRVASPAGPLDVTRDGARSAPRGVTRISGPSFLGLSDEPESSSAASDTPSEYLLDDEQESSSTARSYVALGLILLLGVLLYKQWGPVSAAGRDLIQSAKAATSSTAVPTRQPEIAAKEPIKGSVYHGLEEDTKPQSDNAPVEEATTEKATADAALKDATAAAAAAAPAEEAKAASKATTSPAADAEPEEAAEKVVLGGASRETPVAAKTDTRAKNTPATTPVYDDSEVDLAQKYLQGRGVAQDCNRGVSLLRSAAAQSNPKAQIKLGALYATGHCVTQDRA